MKGEFTVEEIMAINRYLNENYNMDIGTLDKAATEVLSKSHRIFPARIGGISFKFYDSYISRTVDIVAEELNLSDEYNFNDMEFEYGDKVIDIGGNIGMVSIYLAKRYPYLKIYAFEPVLQNYENFKRNIKLNNIPEGTITLEHKAVTSDGRKVNMSINAKNMGGSSISDVISKGAIRQEENTNIESITLEEIFKKYKIDNLRLLKIDCEGSEYEILKNTNTDILKKIQSLRGEFHENTDLTQKYNIKDLESYVMQFIDDVNVVEARNCFIMD